MILNALRSYRYRNRKVFYPRHQGYDKIYVCGNSLLKESSTSRSGYRREYEILSQINHPSIVRVHDHFYEKDKFYIVMRLHQNGDLWQRVFTDPSLDYADILKITHEITEPIAHIHRQGLVHLDVKLENYVQNDSHNSVMIDFEHAQRFKKDYYDQDSLSQISGTALYMAPEIRTLQYGPTSDIYSLGRVLYTVISRRHPNNVITDFTPIRKKAPELEDLLAAMLQPSHRIRPTVFDVVREVDSLIHQYPGDVLAGRNQGHSSVVSSRYLI